MVKNMEDVKMSEEKKFDEKEIKARALEDFNRTLAYIDKNSAEQKRQFKKIKFVYQQLKNLTVEDLEILPAIHPTVSALSYEFAIFWHGQRNDGTFYGNERMEGKWEFKTPDFCISEKGLDDISLKILKANHNNTYNTHMSPLLEETLREHVIEVYKRDNEVSLYNYPGRLRAVISSFSPVSEFKATWGYNPIAAKIKNENGKELYVVINVYEDVAKKFENGFSFLPGYFDFNMIIFDSDKKIYKFQKGLFKYKLI